MTNTTFPQLRIALEFEARCSQSPRTFLVRQDSTDMVLSFDSDTQELTVICPCCVQPHRYRLSVLVEAVA